MGRGRNRRELAQGAMAARSEGVSSSLRRRTLVSRRGTAAVEVGRRTPRLGKKTLGSRKESPW